MRHTKRFRELVEGPEILVLPGVQDALSARIAAAAGFQAVTCGGYAATAALLGEPDTSQLSLTELADHYARIVEATDLPFFADADTGFGNVTNVRRTMRLMERAGVAGLFIEDQVFPKRCGHMSGKAVVSTEEMVGKLKAALDARQDADLVIVARTDALATDGLDAAIERANLYREVGADMLFVEAPSSIEQMLRICAEVQGPCIANNIEGGLTPLLSAAELAGIGYAVAAYPVAITYAVAAAVDRLMQTLAEAGTTAPLHDEMWSFDQFNSFIGLDAVRLREQTLIDYAQKKVAASRAGGTLSGSNNA
jgi:methylisocitrate lyase